MGRRAHSDHRPAALHIVHNVLHLIVRQIAKPGKEDHQVGSFEMFQARDIGVDVRADGPILRIDGKQDDAGKPMALCQDRKLRLLVAGRGNARPYKTTPLCFWREKPVQFLGEVADLVPIYAAADIFILPTIYDPFSNACLEALACGLPVITTRSNGFSEIIEGGVHGSIVADAGSLIDLRDAIRFWSDPSRRRVARTTNIDRASQFDISKTWRKRWTF